MADKVVIINTDTGLTSLYATVEYIDGTFWNNTLGTPAYQAGIAYNPFVEDATVKGRYSLVILDADVMSDGAHLVDVYDSVAGAGSENTTNDAPALYSDQLYIFNNAEVVVEEGVNIKYVNDVEVKGVGSDADPWNPV